MKVNLVTMTQKPIDTIFNAFRICYAKDMDSRQLLRLKTNEDKINWFMPMIKSGHTSTLEHISFTFEIEGVSRSLLSQLTRHRMASYNVQSQRYVNANNFDYILPKDIENIPKAKKYANKKIQEIFKAYNELHDILCDSYINYTGIDKKEAKKKANENARCLLPNATTCNIQMTINLRSFRNFYSLRNCKHAQEEIRELANLMANEIRKHIPFVTQDVMNCGKTCFECIN